MELCVMDYENDQQRRSQFTECVLRASDAVLDAALEIESVGEARRLRNKAAFWLVHLDKITEHLAGEPKTPIRQPHKVTVSLGARGQLVPLDNRI
tara:strand:- start:206 stop:490 length:285 start_codon:yes stop_codon:yes gene_type:complete